MDLEDGILNDTNLTDMSASGEDILIPLDLPAIKREIVAKLTECHQRGLLHTAKWLAEMRRALKKTKIARQLSDTSLLIASVPELSEEDEEEDDVFWEARIFYDNKEYDRCAHSLKDCTSLRSRFLHYYARYLSGEKKRLDNSTDIIKNVDHHQLSDLKDLRSELQKKYDTKQLDGYSMYLYGIVLKRLSLNQLSKEVLLESVHREPCNWAAWLELSYHVSDRSSLQEMKQSLPEHWMKEVFLAHTYLELQMGEDALKIYFGLQAGGLQDSTYLLAQVAIAFHNMREVEQSVDFFKQLLKIDPYRLDNLDTYSNLLYVKEQRVELGHLAHKTVQIDKYRIETCCVIGNYYSLRSQHDKAVQYFQRALKLNPNYLSAWTLMGHEFMELKNTNAAIQSYRHAIEVNRRDYRAWYGLGQTYEILKMPFYCLYYYKQAQELRPNDSRMLVALGESYEKLDKLEDAKKCFWKAHQVGDIEGGIALFQLAKLFEKTNDPDQAAAAYHQYITDTDTPGGSDRDQLSKAYRFLAQYFVNKAQFEEAYHFAQKCTEFSDTREEGKALMMQIAVMKNMSGPSESSDRPSTLTSMRLRPSLDGRERYTGSSPNVNAADRKDLPPMSLDFTP